MTRKQFHGFRTLFWACNLPLALILQGTWLLAYLAILSVCALIESAATDFDQSLKDEKAVKEIAVATADEVSTRSDLNREPVA